MLNRLRPTPLVGSLLLVAAVFVVDLLLPLGVAAAVPYIFAVLIALQARPGWIGPVIAAVCMFLTVAKLELVADRGATELWKVLVNRVLALIAIAITTLLGLLRRRSEARVRDQEAELLRMSQLAVAGEIANELSHELNQPLAAIRLQADIASYHGQSHPSADLREALREIVTQSQRASNILRSMRQTANQNYNERRLTPLSDIAGSAIKLLDWKIKDCGITLEVQFSAKLPEVYANPLQLEQVAFNLLQNAIESIIQRGSGPKIITVSTGQSAEGVYLRVVDSGLGFAQAARLFERFYTTKPDGMGLGLAISRSIAEAHGGQLVASNHANGATFELHLPIAETA